LAEIDKIKRSKSDPTLEIVDSDESEEEKLDVKVTVDASLEKAIEAFRKIRSQKGELTDKELADLDKECDIIRNREIIMSDVEHEIIELDAKGKISMGPPNLTRFEKARIMGARALQLSLGAPTFIAIPVNARTSLDIAMEELEQRVIPISIRRVLPNGDFQNIPLFEFKNE
jgi:DNA-directed RNA polymerase I, II, and III subunit RPABC2